MQDSRSLRRRADSERARDSRLQKALNSLALTDSSDSSDFESPADDDGVRARCSSSACMRRNEQRDPSDMQRCSKRGHVCCRAADADDDLRLTSRRRSSGHHASDSSVTCFTQLSELELSDSDFSVTDDVVTHPGVRCDSCAGTLRGVRWSCCACADFELCDTCYSAGRHALGHAFFRTDVPGGDRIQVAPRSSNIRCLLFLGDDDNHAHRTLHRAATS